MRRVAVLLVVASIAAACSSGGDSSGTTTTPTTAATTTTAAAATTTSQAETTTTAPGPTIPYVDVRVEIDGHRGAANALTNFYAQFGDPTTPEPDVPAGLLEHVAGNTITESTVLQGNLYVGDLTAGRVGVATIDDDIVLLVDEGDGWRVVGAKLARFGLTPWYGDPVRHVLLIGTDARVGQSQTLFRADSIHILSSNIAEQAGSVLGYPRDTYVQASYGPDKFTNVNATSEQHSDEMVSLVEEMSGVPIDGYVITGFVGFQTLVNGFGGVVVDVPFAMADEKSKAYLSKGTQLLWGANALAFSRNRHITGGDFTRSFHQGIVIISGLQGVRDQDITMLPDLLELLDETTWTNLTLDQLLTVAAGAFEIDPANVGNEVLKGTVQTIGGASVVVLDEDAAEVMYRDIDDGVFSSGG